MTARAVAAQLGVRPSALYHHLPDMATLLDQMATAMRRDLVLQPVTGWRELLLETGRVLRRALLAHRDGGRLFAGRRLRDPSLLTAMEEPLRTLVEAGFSLEQAVTALQAVRDLTIGFVIEEQHRASGESGEYDPELRRLLVPVERYPLTAAASEPLFGPPDQRFENELGLVVAGVGTHLPEPGRSGRSRPRSCALDQLDRHLLPSLDAPSAPVRRRRSGPSDVAAGR